MIIGTFRYTIERWIKPWGYAFYFGISSAVYSLQISWRWTSLHKITVNKKLEYARLLMTLGFCTCEFCDAIKEGDSLRVLRYWCYMLLYFKVADWTNYAIKSFYLLVQHRFLFSQRHVFQVDLSMFMVCLLKYSLWPLYGALKPSMQNSSGLPWSK